MTRWCPVCESPGVPVVQRPAIGAEGAIAVSRDLPGIEPSHFCTHCPTFFRSKDRFYLTTQHGRRVHGIAVWPHRERHVSIEIGEEGLVATFHDGTSLLIPKEHTRFISTSHFHTMSKEEIVTWAKRRGFDLRIVSQGRDAANLIVRPSGPHFVLVVAKSWFQSNEVRSAEDAMSRLGSVGVRTVLFPAKRVHA